MPSVGTLKYKINLKFQKVESTFRFIIGFPVYKFNVFCKCY